MVSQVKEEREVIFFIALLFLCYLISGSLGKMVLAFSTSHFQLGPHKGGGPVKGGRGFWLKVNGGH